MDPRTACYGKVVFQTWAGAERVTGFMLRNGWHVSRTIRPYICGACGAVHIGSSDRRHGYDRTRQRIDARAARRMARRAAREGMFGYEQGAETDEARACGAEDGDEDDLGGDVGAGEGGRADSRCNNRL